MDCTSNYAGATVGYFRLWLRNQGEAKGEELTRCRHEFPNRKFGEQARDVVLLAAPTLDKGKYQIDVDWCVTHNLDTLEVSNHKVPRALLVYCPPNTP